MKKINVFDFICLLKSEFVFSSRSWIKIVAQPLVFSTLYFTVIRVLVDRSVTLSENYFSFIASGVIFQSMCNYAVITTCSSIFSRKISNSFDSILVASISNFRVILAFIIGGGARALVIGVIIYMSSFVFMRIHVSSVIITFFSSFLSISFFSMVGVLIGLYITKFETMSNLSTFFLSPLMMISGVFSDINNYPYIFKYIVYVNPFYWLLCFFRTGFIGRGGGSGLLITGVITLLGIVLYHYSSLLLSSKERQHL
ncbi:hypothetical protein D6445_11295 [Salmonella enterica subsp. enterica serovar Infantis]|nr:hypothetical protein [Salmonella enterica subsp. enterica serovar Infantis]